jgi:hypothetical protein
MQSILKMLPLRRFFTGTQQAAANVDESQFTLIEAIINDCRSRPIAVGSARLHPGWSTTSASILGWQALRRLGRRRTEIDAFSPTPNSTLITRPRPTSS